MKFDPRTEAREEEEEEKTNELISADAILETLAELEDNVFITAKHYQFAAKIRELVSLASEVVITTYDDQQNAINELESFLR